MFNYGTKVLNERCAPMECHRVGHFVRESSIQGNVSGEQDRTEHLARRLEYPRDGRPDRVRSPRSRAPRLITGAD
jgi:hypothetical protein